MYTCAWIEKLKISKTNGNIKSVIIPLRSLTASTAQQRLDWLNSWASQGATEEQVAAAVKAANSIWFSQQYPELAVYFNITEGREWKDVDPEIVISR